MFNLTIDWIGRLGVFDIGSDFIEGQPYDMLLWIIFQLRAPITEDMLS